MKAVVTGAAGFIGSYMVRALLDEMNIEVTGIDSLTDYYSPAVKRARIDGLSSPRFSFVCEDLAVADLDALLADTDVVFHLAGQAGVRPSWGMDFDIYVERNIVVTQRLLEWFKMNPGIRSFVYGSSSSIYGNAERYPVTEQSLPAPFSPYGVSKLAAEHLCRLYAENYGVPTISLRYFTVYGPGQRPDMAFARFIKAIRDGTEVQLHGDGSQVRDFTFVEDIVRANLAAAFAADVSPGEVFNICGGSSASINRVLEELQDMAGIDARVHRAAWAAGDVRQTGGSAERAQIRFGWVPQVALTVGLRRQWIAAGTETL